MFIIVLYSLGTYRSIYMHQLRDSIIRTTCISESSMLTSCGVRYDASGNGHEAGQETPEMRPIWDQNVMLGRPGVVFDGRGHTLHGTAVTGESKTVFAVVGTLEDLKPVSLT